MNLDAALVARARTERAAQGLPGQITDPVALDRVARLLRRPAGENQHPTSHASETRAGGVLDERSIA